MKVWNLQNGEELFTLEECIIGDVNTVAINDQRHLVASGDDDNKVTIWDLRTGDRLQTLTGHEDDVESVVFSDDGNLLLSGSKDGYINLWNVLSGKLVQRLRCHGTVDAVALNDAGTMAVSGTVNGTVNVWDLQQREEKQRIQGEYHDSPVVGVSLTSDGEIGVSVDANDTLKVWHVDTGRILHTLREEHRVSSVVFSGTNFLICACEENVISVWDVLTGRLVQSFLKCRRTEKKARGVFNMNLCPSGNIGVWFAGNWCRVWNVEKGKELYELQCCHGNVNIVHVAISGDGKVMITADQQATLKVFEIESARQLNEWKAYEEGYIGMTVALNKYGQQAVSTSHDYRTLIVWDVRTGRKMSEMAGHIGIVRSIMFTSDGRKVVSASDDQSLKVWDVKKSKLLATFRTEAGLRSCCVAGNNETIMAGGLSGIVHFLRLEGE